SLRRPSPQTDAAPASPLAPANRMENPVGQRHRPLLPDRPTTRRLTHRPVPVRPAARPDPRNPKGKLVQASGSGVRHRTHTRPPFRKTASTTTRNHPSTDSGLGRLRLAESGTLRPSVTLLYWLSGPSPFQSQF